MFFQVFLFVSLFLTLKRAYDKINKTKVFTLPGGRQLPVSLIKTVCREYELAETEVDQSAAQALLEQRLLDEIGTLIGTDGEMLGYETTARVTGGVLTVTVEAACREQIGRTVPSRGPAPAKEDR